MSSNDPQRFHQALEQAQRDQRDWDRGWGVHIKGGLHGRSSSWAAIFAVIGVFFGAVAGADAGGVMPAIGAVAGCLIGYALGTILPKGCRFIFITLPQIAYFALRRIIGR
jgi:hypothetical protein